MSKYTTEVRFICENAAGVRESVGYSSINDTIERAIDSVFSFEFPIFDEAYRRVLCKKILKHYYTREICEETVGLWKLRLDTRMNEVMPYFNQLYKSELLEFNPLYDTEITRTSKRDNNSVGEEAVTSERDKVGNSETNDTNSGTNKSTTNQTTEGTSNETNNSTTESTATSETSANTNKERVERDLYSETPQGALTNVENETYLTNARKKLGSETGSDTGESNSSGNSSSTGTTNNSTTGKLDSEINDEMSTTGHSTTVVTDKDTFTSNQNKNINSTEDYLEKVIGKQGTISYSKLIMEYRDTFLNIDMQVIEALSDLFFGIW